VTEEPWSRDEPESPCVRLCVIHEESGLCLGCHRTGDEIARWSEMSAGERAAILAELPGRAIRLARRRGGHRARRG
jgi:hypothetical protein